MLQEPGWRPWCTADRPRNPRERHVDRIRRHGTAGNESCARPMAFSFPAVRLTGNRRQDCHHSVCAGTSDSHFLGLCLGMQCATIEFARNVAGLTGANSAEFDEQSPHPVIHPCPTSNPSRPGVASMRLGAYACIGRGTLAQKCMVSAEVRERHRHRYEFNNAYREQLTAKGLILSGLSPDGRLVEIVELQNHPWFLATQFIRNTSHSRIIRIPCLADLWGRHYVANVLIGC